MTAPGALVHLVAKGEQRGPAPEVPVVGRHEADGGMPVLGVVPAYEASHPFVRVLSRREGPLGELGRYFSVRKRASEKALSSETRGRLKARGTPAMLRFVDFTRESFAAR